MKYVRTQKYKYVDGIDALNDAVFGGWRYVGVATDRLRMTRFLVVKQVKRRVTE